jgi:hypothetical protein
MPKHLGRALLAIILVGCAVALPQSVAVTTAFDGVYDSESTGDPQNPARCYRGWPAAPAAGPRSHHSTFTITVNNGRFSFSPPAAEFTIGPDGTAAWGGRQMIGHGYTIPVKSVWRFTGDSFDGTRTVD